MSVYTVTHTSILAPRHGDARLAVALVCVCERPMPLEVYLWGTVRVDGAHECGRCGRRVWP